MVNPPLKAFGRSLSDFEKSFVDYPAEKQLLVACQNGKTADISKQNQRPTEPTKENTVRASFLRFLALGGDEHAPVHEKGVSLHGAWVDGDLDLEGATLPNSLKLTYCHLTYITLRHSNIHGCVGFQDCHVVKGLSADGMVCSGDVILKDIISTGTVHLLNAKLSGNLECRGGKFDVKDGDALICDRAVIRGSICLNDSFTATGIVSFVAARIDGSLDCSNAVFNGARSGEKDVALACDRAAIKGGVFLRNGFTATGSVRLSGAQIGGNLECMKATLDGMDGYALQAEGVTVVGKFHFNNMRSIKGTVSFSSAKVGGLIDDNQSWTMGELILDGFIYDKLAGNTSTDADTRLKWLDKQSASHAGLTGDGKDFKPQPWQQLQKVLREMGHLEDARQVAIAFEDRLRDANLIGQTPENWCKPTAWVYRKISRGFHRLFGWLIGYGYRPLGLFFKMLVVWLICGAFYWYAALYGDNGNGVFAPSNPLVFQNTEYAVCVPDSCAAKVEKIKSVYATLHEVLPPNNPLVFQNTEYAACVPDSDAAKAEKAKSANAVPPPVQGAGNWYLCEKLPQEYTGFSPFAYSLDLILPLVDLQQEHDWAPRIPTPKSTWTDELFTWDFPKHFTRFLMWFEILFGWMSSLLLVAVVSGLTKRREE
ncbi:MAG: hypothetical protein M0Q44_11535 [Methylobacter sp.]|jgi:hypothetical protein|nr:hypothetical protein [Methylobacter sp.]